MGNLKCSPSSWMKVPLLRLKPFWRRKPTISHHWLPTGYTGTCTNSAEGVVRTEGIQFGRECLQNLEWLACSFNVQCMTMSPTYDTADVFSVFVQELSRM